MQNRTSARPLVTLGEGVYTVSQVCRILQPTMTPRKVHYWLDTSLLSDAIVPGSRGRPTLLSYKQLLEIRTVQRLRDELEFSLREVRRVFEWILGVMFDTHWRDLRFERAGRSLVATAGGDRMEVPGGQGVLEFRLPQLNDDVIATREAWEQRAFVIPGHPFVITDVNVLAGSPTVTGSRVETSTIASFADDNEIGKETLAQVVRMYGRLPREAVEDALSFEGVRIAA